MNTLVANSVAVASMYESFKKGDIPAILSHLHPHVKWVVMGAPPEIPYGRTYNGTADVAAFFKKLVSDYNITSVVVDHVVEINNNKVVALGFMGGTAVNTGKSFETIWAMTWVFDEDGLVTEFHDIYDTQNFAQARKN